MEVEVEEDEGEEGSEEPASAERRKLGGRLT